jgi:hypothetical protein
MFKVFHSAKLSVALIWSVGVLMGSPLLGRAQTTLVFEGFEGAFPGSWSVGDANTNTGLVYWDDVNAAFGGRAPRTGSWKGYCAGIGYAGTSSAPQYTNNMTAYMQRTVNLAGQTRVNLRFWNLVPTIESGFDHCRVFLDGTLLWSNGLPLTAWTEVSTNLNAFAGVSRTLRFEFFSDFTVVREGWYLDDIEVTAASVPVTEQFTGLTLTNYTGYVIDSDRLTNNPAFNRDALRMQSVFTAENFTPSASNLAYRLQYRLLNSSGVAFPILDTNGVTNATYTFNLVTNVALGGGRRLVVTNAAALRPAARLNPYDTYTVECRLFRGAVDTGLVRTDGPYPFFHFTNLVSSDAAFNVLTRLNSAQTNRIAMVNTVPGRSNFIYTVNYETHCYDSFADPANPVISYPLVLNYTLFNSGGVPVALKANSTVINESTFSYEPGSSSPVLPRVRTRVHNLAIEPAGQLDSVNQTYYLQVTISHTNQTGQPALVGNTANSTTERLLHFNGRLYFSSIETTFSSLASDSAPGSLGSGFINTTLTVNNNSGVVTGNPNHTYGSGAALSVRLRANGNAELSAGSVALNAPVPDVGSVNNIVVTRGPITLSTAGARANLTVNLPTGFSYTTNAATLQTLRRHESTLDFANVPLTQALAPASNLSYAPGPPIFSSEETKPLWIASWTLDWNVGAGAISPAGTNVWLFHTRFFENYLQFVNSALTVDPATMSFKRDNSGYYQFVHTGSLTNPVTVFANSKGVAEITLTAQFNNGDFRTHFPYDTRVVWTNGGTLRVERDLGVPGTNSALEGVASVAVPYTTTCPGCNSAPLTNYPTLLPAGQRLRFTRDGGLVADGPLSPSHTLSWGYIPVAGDFAQRVLSFTNAALHVPGHFVRGDHNLQPDDQGASTILLSGVASTNGNYYERPISSGYLLGLADYAGLNFRTYVNNGRQAISRLAGRSAGPYGLSGCSKYYARLSGVSGLHEAFPGTFPSPIYLLGYEMDFANYGLAYLDSQNVDSRTRGLIKVPYPSDFTLDFEEMKFSCVGGLLNAKVAASSQVFKKLAWWNADFEPLTIAFKSNPGQECDPGKGSLVVGVRGYASHVDEPLTGLLGFQTNGNLIAKSFGLEGIDSRLKLPSRLTLAGPTNTAYTITPVADAYYSSYSNTSPANLPPVGFINIAGKAKVPFFDELKIHLHTSARTNGVTPAPGVWLAGGWPRAGSSNPNYGWRVGSDDFFTAGYFDENNFGFPPGVTLANYRNNSTQQYHPRAQKLWLGVVDFDYPLRWTDSARTFKSFVSISNDLVLFKVQHEITYMDPVNASLDFGLQYDGLPKISLANMAFNAIDQQFGVAKALANAAGTEVRDVLLEGSSNLDRLLANTLDDFLEDVFKRTLDPTVDAFYTRLQAEWNALPPASKGQFPNQVSLTLSNYLIGSGPAPVVSNITRQLYFLADGAGQPLGVLKELADTLDEITNAISAITGTISKGTNGVPLGTVKDGLLKLTGGQRPIVKQLVGELVGQLAEQFLSAVAEPHLSNLMEEVEPTLQQITTVLNDVQKALGEVRAKVALGQEFAQELDTKIKSAAAELTNATFLASTEIRSYFNGLNYSIDDPFVHISANEIKAMVRAKVRERFHETALAASLQVSLKQRIYDLDALYREAVDSVFQQLNGVIRQLIGQTLAQLDKTINDALGDLSATIGAGQIDGHALINGDSLKCLRLDAKFRWRVPDDMEFNAYLLIKELDSSATPGCGFSGDSATEVTIGATEVNLEWISPDLRADVAAKFSFQTGPFKPLGMAGSFNVTGGLDFESFEIYKLGAAVAFGLNENYLAALAGIRVQSYDLSGGIFFGRTCTLDPIKMIDPDVASVLGNPPFTGAYLYGEGWIPISEALLGIPASCLFNISAGIGAGAFFFIEGPTYGGIMKAGVLGEALCIVTIKGEVKMIGVKNGDNLRFKGKGSLTGKVGPCPFCIKFGKTVGITYENGSWDVDF